MEQDILKPDATPRGNIQAFSPLGCFLAAAGVALLTFCLLGAAAAASVWAFAKLMGMPDIFLNVLLVLAGLPVLWATVWAGGRAWHIERRLAKGLDVDTPVFRLGYYMKVR
jgi:hypothetical protein